ncbi:MAG: hypothetical protein ABSB69_15280 [Solirubrobacteraceae bacterium]
MRSMLAIPVASLAFAGAHSPALTITSSEAATAMSAQIHKQAAARLRGGFRGETLCSGRVAGGQTVSSTTELDRWHCTLELGGARFPSPCKAEANVFATDQAHRVRIEWLAESRFCR